MHTLGAGFTCSFCGEWNDTAVDPGGATTQDYVEDCQVCCRPNVLHVTVDPETGQASIWAELES